MNRSYRITPVYTGDVSGVCSALYELGGMVVMHDPSGCNSTYNTHDETRWYDQDSLIFLSGLSHLDALFGNDEKLIRDVTAAAEALHPRFVALAGSPIPYLNGTDFRAICRILEKRTGLPVFHIPTNGMHDYSRGGGAALAEIARRFVLPSPTKCPRSVNLLGVTPLDFEEKGSVASLRQAVEELGFDLRSCWSMGDSLDTLARAGEAQVNLVVSALGLPAAGVLEERFGLPWVAGLPIGKAAPLVGEALRTAAVSGRSAALCAQRPGTRAAEVVLIGEPVRMGSLAQAISLQYGLSCQVLCPLEGCGELIAPVDRLVHGEEEAEALLVGAKAIVADPLYRPICPKNAAFYPLPHLAFSGRCFRNSFVDLWSVPELER